MLHIITDLTDPLLALIKDDPVRPHIPLDFRVSEHSRVFVLLDDMFSKAIAVVCVAFKDTIPISEHELQLANHGLPTVAVFYTIWSYTQGAGRKLIQATQEWIKINHSSIDHYVTLSPPTDMARKFHLKNGADIHSVNPDTVNYIYK